jgi:hypothetical protein
MLHVCPSPAASARTFGVFATSPGIAEAWPGRSALPACPVLGRIADAGDLERCHDGRARDPAGPHPDRDAPTPHFTPPRQRAGVEKTGRERVGPADPRSDRSQRTAGRAVAQLAHAVVAPAVNGTVPENGTGVLATGRNANRLRQPACRGQTRRLLRARRMLLGDGSGQQITARFRVAGRSHIVVDGPVAKPRFRGRVSHAAAAAPARGRRASARCPARPRRAGICVAAGTIGRMWPGRLLVPRRGATQADRDHQTNSKQGPPAFIPGISAPASDATKPARRRWRPGRLATIERPRHRSSRPPRRRPAEAVRPRA